MNEDDIWDGFVGGGMLKEDEIMVHREFKLTKDQMNNLSELERHLSWFLLRHSEFEEEFGLVAEDIISLDREKQLEMIREIKGRLGA